MKRLSLTGLLTIIFIACTGLLLHHLPKLQAQLLDTEASASKLSLYGSKDYNRFLTSFYLDPTNSSLEVLSLHTEQTVYVLLINSQRAGGATLGERMSGKVPATELIIPYDQENSQYLEHVQETAAYLKQLGYQPKLKGYTTLEFKSMVHANHFDMVLLEMRSLS